MFAWYLRILTGLVVISFKGVTEIVYESQHDDCMHDYELLFVIISRTLSDHTMHNHMYQLTSIIYLTVRFVTHQLP